MRHLPALPAARKADTRGAAEVDEHLAAGLVERLHDPPAGALMSILDAAPWLYSRRAYCSISQQSHCGCGCISSESASPGVPLPPNKPSIIPCT